MKTIFLDFDGVLHVIQANFEERFSKLYLLEDLAKDFSFEVVISSTWRLFYDVSSLKENLKTLGERVVGVTGDTLLVHMRDTWRSRLMRRRIIF